MSFITPDAFAEQFSTNADPTDTAPNPEAFEWMPASADGIPIDLDGDSIADGWGYDLNGDDKIDMVQYDFDHNNTVDAVGYDTTGTGFIDTLYLDFDHDHKVDAIAMDSDGSGTFDTLTFAADGSTLVSDTGFSLHSAWQAGLTRFDTGNDLLSDQADQLGLDSGERQWSKKALEQEELTPETAKKQISFGATCLTGTIKCAGCAGYLQDKTMVCITGSCSGGVKR